MVTQSKSLAAAVPGGSSNLIRPRRAASCSNALTLAMYEAMTAPLEGANADDSVHCVLVAGVPGAFSAGKAIPLAINSVRKRVYRAAVRLGRADQAGKLSVDFSLLGEASAASCRCGVVEGCWRTEPAKPSDRFLGASCVPLNPPYQPAAR
jgi:hypothetical protein